MPARFPTAMLAQFAIAKHLYIRSGDHRFIPIWVVVVEGRVLVRSWNDKADGWYRAFLTQPAGAVRLGDRDHWREVPVRAVAVGSLQLKDATGEAYAQKYTTKASAKYVSGFKNPKRKTTTLELVPAG